MTAQPAVVAIGANLDGPEARVRRAFDELASLAHTRVLERSAIYRTAPVGIPDQPAFINACARVETSLAPRALLEGLLDIERRHGRVRDVPNGPRTLDLDIVLYGDLVMHEHGLTIPHPRAHERAFVLAPLLDVWPDAIIPGHGAAAALRERVRGQAIERLPEAQ